jgi:peroxiredoxin
VLNKENGMDARTTFVIGQDGKIEAIQENADALDPTGAADACSRSAHKAAQ